MGQMKRRLAHGATVLVGSALALLAGLGEAQEVRHLYDAKGQLIAVIDLDGSAATYTWSETGNLIAITRTDASTISGPVGINLVSPNQGLPGDLVEIFGKGLADPTSVTFNGIAATPLTSTSTSIKTTVPSGATTGLIHVATALGAADSPSPFTVQTSMSVMPTSVSLLPTRTVQFSASGSASWFVNGIAGGNGQVGTVSSGGLYTAPGTGIFPLQVSVAAQSPGNPQNRAEATVTILPVPVARAARVSVALAGAPPQAVPLTGARVSLAVSQTPAQAAPLAAARVSLNRQPVITGVSPGSLARGSSNVTLTITGQGLANATALQFLRNGANDTLITYTNLTATPDGTQATATISIGSGAVIAGRVLQITAGGVTSTPAGTGTNVLQVTGP
jgi:YD repeat-containing protein